MSRCSSSSWWWYWWRWWCLCWWWRCSSGRSCELLNRLCVDVAIRTWLPRCNHAVQDVCLSWFRETREYLVDVLEHRRHQVGLNFLLRTRAQPQTLVLAEFFAKSCVLFRCFTGIAACTGYDHLERREQLLPRAIVIRKVLMQGIHGLDELFDPDAPFNCPSRRNQSLQLSEEKGNREFAQHRNAMSRRFV